MNDEMEKSDEKDEFPIGLRVLSVDDDLICLKILEANLVQCKYKVTSTTSAIEALNILRQNESNFDIIVTDAHMPGMDGFTLLEHVGLEMDLPCIMVSANDDPKTVMKGIEHGACDYLLKPARVEQLKNIWQHVIRRKKACREHIECKNTSSDHGEGGNNDKRPHSKPKNEQNDDQVEEDEEAMADNNGSTSTKKPRIVWTRELHQKFMDAIKAIGVRQAVPKKILEVMDVEGLSRENVASHLQKYRLYLKKLEEKANMMALMGSRDLLLNHVAYDRYNDFEAFSSSSNHVQTLQPYVQNTTFNRGNSGMVLENNNVARGVVQVPLHPHINNRINSHGNIFHQGNIHQQMPPTSQKRPLIHENSSFNGFQTSTNQTLVNENISMPMNSTMIHSTAASNHLPMNIKPMLPPKDTQAGLNTSTYMNHMNFASSNGSAPCSTIGVNNNRTFDHHMLMENVMNNDSNYLNFGSASQSLNRNIALGSQFDGKPLFDPNSSHSQRLNVGSNNIGMNANGHQDCNNNMPPAEQQCKIIKSGPDNPFKNGDDISFLDNSLWQGDMGSSGCIFDELESLI